MSTKTVLLLTELPDGGARRLLRRASFEGHIQVRAFYPPYAGLSQAAARGCSGVICRPTDPMTITTELLAEVEDPFFIATLSAGTEHLSEVVSRLPHARVISSRSGNAAGVAELAVTLVNDLLRPVYISARRVEQGVFENSFLRQATRMEGKTWLIIGAGSQVQHLIARIANWRLGRIVVWHPEMDATILKSCLAQIPTPCLAYSTDAPFPSARLLGAGKSETPIIGSRDLDSVSESDIISLHVPAQPANPQRGRAATIGLLSAELLQKIKRGAVIVNVARGRVVDEEAVLNSLKQGHLRGYASDVVYAEAERERDPGLSPLWSYYYGQRDVPVLELHDQPRLIITSHLGGSTDLDFDAVALEVIGRLFVELGISQA